LNRSALGGLGLKGLPIKPEFANAGKGIGASLDDSIESKRKLEKLGDMPAVDMSMTEDGVGVGDLEVDDDDDDANRMDQVIKGRTNDAMDVDEDDEADPLDAFMSRCQGRGQESQYGGLEEDWCKWAGESEAR
jgi:ATP-dependent RNA helicase DDX46/PRP5